ncbi:MAG: nucleotidyltransferase substrate binding protein [Nitrospirae bacterium]|nr:nucleotidyltransferase substrate binding protein [Nitrospirota bacterium]
MERVALRHKSAIRAVGTLREILGVQYSVIVRDASIQRFEYSFETLWKLLKEYLRFNDGVVCNSPKSCFKEALSTGLLTSEDTVAFLEMTDDRNLTSHTYMEEIADTIYSNLERYCSLMEKVLEKFDTNMSV